MVKKYSKISILWVLCLLVSGCGKVDSEPAVSELQDNTDVIENKVEDTIPPELATVSDALYSELGEKIEYGRYYTLSDNIDSPEEIKISIDESRIDFTKVGKYTLSICATDSSNNSSTLKIPYYLYKKYKKDEIYDLITQLVDDQYYDFKYGEFNDETKREGFPVFWLSDNSVLTNEPSGSTQIVGWIDYLVSCAQVSIYIDSEDFTNTNNVQKWNKHFVLNLSEYTSYAEVYDLKKVEIVSKEGKMDIDVMDNLFCNRYENWDITDYKGVDAWIDIGDDEEVQRFKQIINGNNASVRFISNNDEEFASLVISDKDLVNLNSSISFYESLDEYIINVPFDKVLSTETDASETDSE